MKKILGWIGILVLLVALVGVGYFTAKHFGWFGLGQAKPAETATHNVATNSVDTSEATGAVVRLQADGWPIENGKNALVEVSAPKALYLLINYGAEARDPKSGKEVAGCGAVLVNPGETVSVLFWDGNGETLQGDETNVVAYAQSVLSARMAADTNCKLWLDPIGFSLP